MGQLRHGSATTTEAVRRAIQHSQESLRALAKRYGINQKTAAKWRSRDTVAADFLRHLIAAVPYKIHTVLTDNGIHFTTPGAGGSAVAKIKEAMANGHLFRAHAFEFACAKNDIDHRLTKPKHPWTNG